MRRSDWTTHPPVRPLAAMPAMPSGFAVHWPGMTKGSAPTTQAGVASRLESYRVLHTSPGGIGTKDGGNDIAYQWCADLMGRLWPLRGFTHKSGANGSADSNDAWGAVLLMLGPDDFVSAAMLEAVRVLRHDQWLRLYPRATKIIGHRDVYGTDCPGDRAYRFVASGAFAKAPKAPTPTPEDDDMTPAELTKALADHDEDLIRKLLTVDLGKPGGNDTVGVALQSGLANGRETLERLATLEATVADIKAALPPAAT